MENRKANPAAWWNVSTDKSSVACLNNLDLRQGLEQRKTKRRKRRKGARLWQSCSESRWKVRNANKGQEQWRLGQWVPCSSQWFWLRARFELWLGRCFAFRRCRFRSWSEALHPEVGSHQRLLILQRLLSFAFTSPHLLYSILFAVFVLFVLRRTSLQLISLAEKSLLMESFGQIAGMEPMASMPRRPKTFAKAENCEFFCFKHMDMWLCASPILSRLCRNSFWLSESCHLPQIHQHRLLMLVPLARWRLTC